MGSQDSTVLPCLILTATVQVKDDVAFVARKDTATRLADYLSSFQRWVRTAGVSSIIFVENSGYDLARFRDLAAEVPGLPVEFVSFVCPAFDGSLGKGYGEMLCLQRCLDQSHVLRNAHSFLKVTGRYYIANAPSLMHYLSKNPSTDVICNLERDLSWADSRAFGGSRAFLQKYLSPMLYEIDDSKGSAFEHVLARAAHRVMAERGLWMPLPEALQVHGVSGTIGYDFTPGILKVLREKLKHHLYLWSLNRDKSLTVRLLRR